jgi:nucleoside permease NupC
LNVANYALCGFANPGSLGIMIGGFLLCTPSRSEIAKMSIKPLSLEPSHASQPLPLLV